jgi:hypothetical protein
MPDAPNSTSLTASCSISTSLHASTPPPLSVLAIWLSMAKPAFTEALPTHDNDYEDDLSWPDDMEDEEPPAPLIDT